MWGAAEDGERVEEEEVRPVREAGAPVSLTCGGDGVRGKRRRRRARRDERDRTKQIERQGDEGASAWPVSGPAAP